MSDVLQKLNVDKMKSAMKKLDKVRPYLFSKDDKDEFIGIYIKLRNLCMRYNERYNEKEIQNNS